MANFISGRVRNFACVVYEDSAPQNWLEILQGQSISRCILFCHDKDLNSTVETIKPHWHVLITFDSFKTFEQAKNFFSLIGGVCCAVVHSVSDYISYIRHLDSLKKV